MQKAVVVVTDSPQHFGAIKAQLGVVTAAWFAQRCVQGYGTSWEKKKKKKKKKKKNKKGLRIPG